MKKIIYSLIMLMVVISCSVKGQESPISNTDNEVKFDINSVVFGVRNKYDGSYYNCEVGPNDYKYVKNKKQLEISRIDCSFGKNNDPSHLSFFNALEKHVKNNKLYIDRTYLVQHGMLLQNYLQDNVGTVLTREQVDTLSLFFAPNHDETYSYIPDGFSKEGFDDPKDEKAKEYKEYGKGKGWVAYIDKLEFFVPRDSSRLLNACFAESYSAADNYGIYNFECGPNLEEHYDVLNKILKDGIDISEALSDSEYKEYMRVLEDARDNGYKIAFNIKWKE